LGKALTITEVVKVFPDEELERFTRGVQDAINGSVPYSRITGSPGLMVKSGIYMMKGR